MILELEFHEVLLVESQALLGITGQWPSQYFLRIRVEKGVPLGGDDGIIKENQLMVPRFWKRKRRDRSCGGRKFYARPAIDRKDRLGQCPGAI
jgi:hypothetical protein